MKKGDLRKQEILKTAETLFCRNGYEQTGVQDILNELHASKGSFYHHFVSKESLLEAMFVKRAENACRAVADTPEDDPLLRMDRLLSAVIPMRDEQLTFLMMLLPIFSRPEGRTLKTQYCDSLSRCFQPFLAEAIRQADEKKLVLAGDADIVSEQCLLLVNRLWIRICEMIVQNEGKGQETDTGDVLHLAEQYRRALEKILTAPYGSLSLMDLPEVKYLIERIHTHWKAPAAQAGVTP